MLMENLDIVEVTITCMSESVLLVYVLRLVPVQSYLLLLEWNLQVTAWQ